MGPKIVATMVGVIMLFALAATAGAGSKEKGSAMKSDDPGPEVVDKVDVDRYMGTWYEIAKIPMYFQRKCAGGTTATYSLKENGDVKVVNKCYTEDREVVEAKGVAWVVDEKTNAKLKVSFLPFGLKWFGGDYWVIGLDPDYKWAVVGHPDREYGWVLSRTKTLPDETMDKIVKLLEDKGYDYSKFTSTEQKSFP